MEWWVAFIVLITSMLILLILGIPVFVVFFLISIVYIAIYGGVQALTLLPGSVLDSLGSFVIIPVPLFMFLGEMLFRGGWVDLVFDAADSLVGRIRARMYVITFMAAAFLGAISGSSIAMAAAFGTSLVPTMLSRGYDRKLTFGSILAGALLDPIIPPTILGVVLASMANVSVGKLMIGGIVPGLFLGGMYALYTVLAVYINPGKAPSPEDIRKTLNKRALSLLRITPLLILIFLVLGLMGLGIATPSESAATGVIGALILNAVRRRLSVKEFKEALLMTAKTTAMVLMILAASRAYSQALGISGAVEGLAKVATKVEVSPMVLLVFMQFIIFVLGCLIDQVSIIMICVPIFLPIVEHLGFEPIWFWVMILCNLSLGGITPPFGLLLFTLKGACPKAPLEEIYQASVPFVVITVIGLILLAVFPSIITVLPNLMRW